MTVYVDRIHATNIDWVRRSVENLFLRGGLEG